MRVNKKTKMEINELFVALYALNDKLFNPNSNGDKSEWLENMSKYDLLKEELGDGEASETIKEILKTERKMFQCENDSNEYIELWGVSSSLREDLDKLINISDYTEMIEVQENIKECQDDTFEYIELWKRLTLLEEELNKEVK